MTVPPPLAGDALHHPLSRARVSQVPFRVVGWILQNHLDSDANILAPGHEAIETCFPTS
jgi:hypothetical protein